MIPCGNLNLRWEMWSTRLVNMWVNIKTFSLFVSLKYNQLSKAKTIEIVRFCIYLKVKYMTGAEKGWKEGTSHTVIKCLHCR